MLDAIVGTRWGLGDGRDLGQPASELENHRISQRINVHLVLLADCSLLGVSLLRSPNGEARGGILPRPSQAVLSCLSLTKPFTILITVLLNDSNPLSFREFVFLPCLV